MTAKTPNNRPEATHITASTRWCLRRAAATAQVHMATPSVQSATTSMLGVSPECGEHHHHVNQPYSNREELELAHPVSDAGQIRIG